MFQWGGKKLQHFSHVLKPGTPTTIMIRDRVQEKYLLQITVS